MGVYDDIGVNVNDDDGAINVEYGINFEDDINVEGVVLMMKKLLMLKKMSMRILMTVIRQ